MRPLARHAAVLALTLGSMAVGWAPGAARPAAGQAVTGVVLDAATSAPLPGVLLSLLDSDDERVGAVLSDEAGRFAMEVARFGLYRLRAERIGLQTTISDSFRVFGTDPHFERVLMGSRAVEIAGLVVDSRVEQCRIDQGEAVRIQRWWQEVRTALGVSSVVQGQGLAHFEVERFERTWGPELRRIVSTDSRREMSLSDRPFVSADAEFLSQGGFVQGEVTGQREYYAPDAEVLLSNVFLSEHCFSLTEHDDEESLLGLSFEPTRERDVVDIHGTLWVDTTTAELRSLDFRYSDMDDLPENESGGFVSFEYLPSGAWVVRDWYIRMPRLGSQRPRGREELVLLGYMDVGGRLTPLETASVDTERLGAVGAILGVVYDSIHGRGLSGATVSIIGTRFQAVTGDGGEFTLTNVPVGEHHVTFFHETAEAWGLGSPYGLVEVDEGRTSSVRLALPGFRQTARILCMGSGPDAEAVLLGRLVDAEGEGLGNVTIEVGWDEEDVSGVRVTNTQEYRTGSDGRYYVCTAPSEMQLRVRLRVDDRWIEAYDVTLPHHDVVYREVHMPFTR